MKDTTQDRLIQQAKAIAELKWRGHDPMDEEIRRVAYDLSSNGNRKQRRAFEALNRKRAK